LREFVLTQKIDIIINQWVLPFYATLVWKLALRGTNCKVFSVNHGKPDTNGRIKELERLIEFAGNIQPWKEPEETLQEKPESEESIACDGQADNSVSDTEEII
jgi:hypothetical protein